MKKMKPNILFLLNDHQAYYRHGWDGGVKPACPYFERFAKSGIEFERAYSVCPLCLPARRSMLTGLYPHNHGFLNNDEEASEWNYEFIFPYLQEQGYKMFYYGKWHAGPGTAHDYGCEGFSYPHYGNPYLTPEYDAYIRERGLEHASFDIKHLFTEPESPDRPEPGPGYRCMGADFHPHAAGLLETSDDTHESFFLANLACEKLRELADRENDEPFFLRVDFYGPHMPYFAGKKYADMYPPEQIQEYASFRDDLKNKPEVYRTETNEQISKDGKLLQPNPLPWNKWQEILSYCYGQITMVDAAGGKILEEIERLGLAENTLIIWTTDHGDAVASHGGHFDKNAYLSEEVLRIPMAMSWPRYIPAGQVSQALVSNMDTTSTVLDAAGTGFKNKVFGRSILDVSMGNTSGSFPWREEIVCETHGHHGEKVTGRALITKKYKYAVYKYEDKGTQMNELYDLINDPYEMKNLVEDSAYLGVVEEMSNTSK